MITKCNKTVTQAATWRAMKQFVCRESTIIDSKVAVGVALIMIIEQIIMSPIWAPAMS